MAEVALLATPEAECELCLAQSSCTESFRSRMSVCMVETLSDNSIMSEVWMSSALVSPVATAGTACHGVIVLAVDDEGALRSCCQP